MAPSAEPIPLRLPRWLPARLRAAAAARPLVARLLENASWLAGERVAVLALAFFFNAWFVRALGPEEYGRYSWAVSFAALFGALATLGMDSLVVRSLARAPGDAGEILGTAGVLRLAAGALAWAATGIVALAFRDDGPSRALVVIVGASSLFLGAGVFELWFQARLAARGTSLGRVGVAVLVQLGRGALILLAAPTWAFGLLYTASHALTSAVACFLFLRSRGPTDRLRASAARARELARDTVPLAFSAVCIAVYMKVDQVMLVAMVGDRENGLYAPAAMLSEVLYFLPVAIGASAFPIIVRARDELSPGELRQRLQQFYDAMAALGYAVAIPMAILAGPIVHLLFGPAYAETAGVLRAHVASFLFTTLGIARGRFLVADGRTWFAFASTALGAAANVLLNLLLIPRHGAMGAAWATVAAYLVANHLSSYLWRPVWPQAALITRSILLPARLVLRGLRRLGGGEPASGAETPPGGDA
jgi:O-antigen/teichoic acid export membrane protein